jgi:hypothetical protein
MGDWEVVFVLAILLGSIMLTIQVTGHQIKIHRLAKANQ